MTTSDVPAETWTWLVHPIFARCVDPEMVRYDLSRPFVIQEYVYATNGKIAVRMPVPEGWTIPNPERLVPPRLLFELFGKDDWSRSPWRPEPTELPPVEGVCSVCSGAKVLPEIACPWCKDESPGPSEADWAQARRPHEAGFCDECCELWGKIPAGPCYECGGAGLLDAYKRIEVVPGYWLQRKHVAMLHEFAMTTYLPVKLHHTKTTRFTQGDVSGVLMPMTAPNPGER